MIFNMGGGGNPYAAIGVIFAPGSVCTCSNGTSTLTSNEPTGYVVFAVTNGTWTVTCGAISKSVTIDHKGQCEIVNVKRFYLFHDLQSDYKDGTLTTGAGNGFTWTTPTSPYGGDSYYARVVKQIDITNYSSINAVVSSHTCREPAGGAGGLTISETSTGKFPKQSYAVTESSATYTFDISEYSGFYYVGLSETLTSAWITKGVFIIKEMYLE